MKATVDRKVLLSAVKQAVLVVPKRSTYPVLQNIKLEAKYNKVHVTATDLDTHACYTVEADETEGRFRVIVPGKVFLETLKRSKERTVTVAPEGSAISLTFGDVTVKLAGLDPAEYPERPTLGEKQFNYLTEELLRLVDATKGFVNKDESRPAMTGIFLEFLPDGTKATATDGHQLRHISDGAPVSEGLLRVILPPKVFTYIPKDSKVVTFCRIDPGKNDKGEQIPDTAIMLSGPDWWIVTRLIEGPYPDYDHVIPKDYKARLTYDTDEMLNALEQVRPYANPVATPVKLSLNGKCILSAETCELGHVERPLNKASYDGADFTTCFNADLMFSILAHASPGSSIMCDARDWRAIYRKYRNPQDDGGPTPAYLALAQAKAEASVSSTGPLLVCNEARTDVSLLMPIRGMD